MQVFQLPMPKEPQATLHRLLVALQFSLYLVLGAVLAPLVVHSALVCALSHVLAEKGQHLCDLAIS